MSPENDTGYDWMWGAVGPTAVSLPVGLAGKVYADKLLTPNAGAPKTLEERKLLRKLVAEIEAKNIRMAAPACTFPTETRT